MKQTEKVGGEERLTQFSEFLSSILEPKITGSFHPSSLDPLRHLQTLVGLDKASLISTLPFVVENKKKMIYRAVIFGAVDFGSMIIDRATAVVDKSKAASD
eukprot:4814954-Alexandrium_andersonii.AAC.1